MSGDGETPTAPAFVITGGGEPSAEELAAIVIALTPVAVEEDAGPDDVPRGWNRAALIEAVEGIGEMELSDQHPQGAKRFNGKTHQAFGHQYISQVQEGKLIKVHTTSIEDTLYPDEVDYTTQSL